eukprot:971020-Amorphochlora_amoeboformis.AAC.1
MRALAGSRSTTVGLWEIKEFPEPKYTRGQCTLRAIANSPDERFPTSSHTPHAQISLFRVKLSNSDLQNDTSL